MGKYFKQNNSSHCNFKKIMQAKNRYLELFEENEQYISTISD